VPKTTFNTDADWMAIDYRLSRHDRLYGANPFVVAELKGKRPDATPHPFDTVTLRPHSTWHLPAGAEVVNERVLRD
jgi:hypothetical protein